MEIIVDTETSYNSDDIRAWDINDVREVRYDETKTSVFCNRLNRVQKIYSFTIESGNELSFRKTTGFLSKKNTLNSIWLKGHGTDCGDILICIEPNYVYQQTGCLISPRIAELGENSIISILDLCQFSIREAIDILRIGVDKVLSSDEIPKTATTNYISLDVANSSQLLILSDNNTLDKIEDNIRNYCESYWNAYSFFGNKINLIFSFYINPKKRVWTNDEISDLDNGDLIAIQNFRKNDSKNCIRGYIQTISNFFPLHRYEVYLKMNEDDTRLEFGKDDLYSTDELESDASLPPHEQIELEIFAGKTRILFSELCSVQEGSLIEIRDHSLPMVTLSVMGTPILEGELVHFQDQLMVQITRKIS